MVDMAVPPDTNNYTAPKMETVLPSLEGAVCEWTNRVVAEDFLSCRSEF